MNNPPSGPFDKLMVLSLSKDFDSGLYRPPLRANLERVRSTLSKPGTKIFNLLRVLIHESKRSVNNAG
jgi:hypothetical protein